MCTPARRRGGGRPRWGGGPASGRGRRSVPPARPARAPACRPRGARGRRRLQRHARAPARASLGRSRSRARAGRSRARPESRHGRSRRRARPAGAVPSGGELDVEGDVVRHVHRPVVVDRRESVVETHVALSLARDDARAAALYAAPARRGGARVAAPPVSSRGVPFPHPRHPEHEMDEQER